MSESESMHHQKKRNCRPSIICVIAACVILPLITGMGNTGTNRVAGGNSPQDQWGASGIIPRRAATDDPIHIVGDAGWQAAKAAGNCTGEGTDVEPYVISSKVIDAGGTTSGIWIENTTACFRVEDCRINNSVAYPGAGIRLVNVTNGVLLGNNYSDNAGSGVYLERGCWNITVRENTLTRNTYGIALEANCSRNTLAGNNATFNTMYGIATYNACHDNTVEGNRAGNNTLAGIILMLNSTGNVVRGNTATGNHGGIVLAENCSDCRVEGNIVTHNHLNGIEAGLDADNSTIAGNSAAGNSEGGIHVYGNSNATIAGNNCTGNAWYGIRVQGAAANGTFEENEVSDSGRHGIVVGGNSCNITITGNTITGSQWRGIAFAVGANGSLVCNNSLGNNLAGNAMDNGTFNRWDNGSCGNAWDDYGGTDPDDDGIGNPHYAIPGTAGAADNFPLCNDGDNLPPVITSTDLANNQLCGPSAPDFALAITDASPTSEGWVSYDGGAHNWTCGQSGSLPEWSSLANGTATLTFWANDTAGNIADPVTITLRKDSLAPLLAAWQDEPCCNVPDYVPAFIVTATDAQLDQTWYTIGASPARYFFTGQRVPLDAAAWAALPAGDVTVNFHANDTLGNERAFPYTLEKEKEDEGDPTAYWIIGGLIAAGATIGIGLYVKMRKKRVDILQTKR